MKQLILALMLPIMVVTMTACSGSSAEQTADPEMKEKTIEMETVADDLDSTLQHIEDLDAALESALKDLEQ